MQAIKSAIKDTFIENGFHIGRLNKKNKPDELLGTLIVANKTISSQAS